MDLKFLLISYLINLKLFSVNSCNIQIVETVPEEIANDSDNSSYLSTFEAWMWLINQANKSLLIASYHWDLKTSHKTYGDELFKSLYEKKNVKIQILQNIPSLKYPNNDARDFQKKINVEVRSMDLKENRGIMHSKIWVVDNKHVYIGSANVGWQSFLQLKELGILIKNCPCLAEEAEKVFKIHWNLSQNESFEDLTTNVKECGNSYFSIALPRKLPKGWTSDLEAIIHSIKIAKSFIHISVMKYAPLREFSNEDPLKISYWHDIDTALRAAAINNRVSIKILVSFSKKSKPYEELFLRSLMDISNLSLGIDVEVKQFIVPETPKGFFYMHSKYMVTDQVAYIGTSNWSGDYFTSNTGIGFVAQDTQHENLTAIRSQLESIFKRDWNSKFAKNLKNSSSNL